MNKCLGYAKQRYKKTLIITTYMGKKSEKSYYMLMEDSIKPKSIISVMMIIDFIFEQTFYRFEGAMMFHYN